MTTKAIGQAQSLAGVSDQAHRSFLRILDEISEGHPITTNSIRERLDMAQIPRRARGALMGHACRNDLIEAVTVIQDGVLCELRVVSTGLASRGSAVRLYRRTGKKAL